MIRFGSTGKRKLIFLLVMLAAACAPIWLNRYFINQDGSGHVYSSHLMLRLMNGDPAVSGIFVLNSISIPNSSGHWLMVLLLTVFSPFLVTKLMATITFGGAVVAVACLRIKTVGYEGVATAILIGCAVGFNWLWLVGAYNFMLGVIGFAITLAVFNRWREQMTFIRCLVISLLLALVFISHIIAFLVLSGSLIILAAFVPRDGLKHALAWTFAAFLPVLPLIILFKFSSQGGEVFDPAWRSLSDPYSLSSWIAQFRTADPFILISRKTFPFTSADSNLFAVFAPILWIGTAITILVAGTLKEIGMSGLFTRERLPFLILFTGTMAAVIFAPDDFGLMNGSLLRERLLICGLVLFVPLFRTGDSVWLKRAAQICLFVICTFQIAVLWEYSILAEKQAEQYLAVRSEIADGDSIASVTILDDGLRFHSSPTTQLSSYLGIGKNVTVWDNYEIGHYLFPVVAKDDAAKQFIFNLTTSNTFVRNDPNFDFDGKLARLDSCLALNHDRIDKMILWGRDAQVEAILVKWFESEPIFSRGEIRLFRRRQL